MKIDLIDENLSISLGTLIEQGYSPIDIYIPSRICNEIRDKHFTGKFSSYPIYKNDECYYIECEVDPNMMCICWGGEEEWSCSLTNLIMPMAMRLKEEYDAMVANTKKEEAPMLINECRSGGSYKCFHSLYDLYLEHLILDTEDMTLEMELGS